jgi:D-glycero-D-manno-heptose 1,7-bisphosphate phosphatase
LTKSGNPFRENIFDWRLRDKIEAYLSHMKEAGFLIIGISNQGGVAHGHKTVRDVQYENEALLKKFDRNPFDRILFCPFEQKGTVEPFNKRSLLRKPDMGMVAVAEYEFYNKGIIIDLNGSYFVGDRMEDEGCAISAGIEFVDINKILPENASTETTILTDEKSGEATDRS